METETEIRSELVNKYAKEIISLYTYQNQNRIVETLFSNDLLSYDKISNFYLYEFENDYYTESQKEDKLEEMNSELASLQDELEKLDSYLEQLESNKNVLEEQKSDLADEISMLEEETHELEYDSYFDEDIDMQNKAKENETRIAEIEDEVLPQLEQQIELLENEIKETEDAYNEKEEEIAEKEEAIKEFENSLAEETREIFEYILIDGYLGRKLENFGESVLWAKEFDSVYWCRATFGQAWYMDYCIQEIAKQIYTRVIEEQVTKQLEKNAVQTLN